MINAAAKAQAMISRKAGSWVAHEGHGDAIVLVKMWFVWDEQSSKKHWCQDSILPLLILQEKNNTY